jgi:Fe-S cluster assembly protein SufD
MEAVEATLRQGSGQAPAWLKERRDSGASRFAQTGYPTTRQEDWRFTNVAPIADAKFAPAEGSFAKAATLVEGVAVRGSLRLAERRVRCRAA